LEHPQIEATAAFDDRKTNVAILFFGDCGAESVAESLFQSGLGGLIGYAGLEAPHDH
jgi:hypothetical protein